MKKHTTHCGYALVICNGDIPSKRTVASLLRRKPFILCADGGANKARLLGVRPHVIIGDMDSITKGTRKYFADAEMIHRADQYSTDFEKALDYLTTRGVRNAVVIGATGGRLDHSLANLSILKKYRKKIHLLLTDEFCDIELIDKKVTLDAPAGTVVSLMPMGRCAGITTKGLKYSLDDETLELGVREGASNEVVSSPVRITVRKGSLLLFVVKKK